MIVAVAGDGEAIRYADELLSVIQAAGWPSHGIVTPNVAALGLVMTIRDAANPPPGADVLLAALTKAGVQVVAAQDSTWTPGLIRIIVGNKPQQ